VAIVPTGSPDDPSMADGDAPDDLPRVIPAATCSASRDAYVHFIGAANVRNPAAAAALDARMR
jgi:hypothetical protein